VAIAVGKRTFLGLQLRLAGFKPAHIGPDTLFADAELRDHRFVPLRVVLLQIVQQAATPAHHHQKSAARAVILLVRFEVLRELTDALA